MQKKCIILGAIHLQEAIKNKVGVTFFIWSNSLSLTHFSLSFGTPISRAFCHTKKYDLGSMIKAHSASATVSGSGSTSKLLVLVFFAWHLGLVWLLTRQFNLGHSTLRAWANTSL